MKAALSRHAFVLALLLCLVLATAPRLAALFYDDSVFYPDEIFQTLEQGHRFAFGYGFIPWEFREAARSWLLPGALGLVLKLGAALGLKHGPALAHLARGFMVLIALGGQWATMRVAYARQGLGATLIAGAMYAAFPLLVFFDARCLTEVASATALVCGALALFGEEGPPDRAPHRALIGGLLIGTSIFFRAQNGLVGLTILVVLLFQRRFRDVGAFIAGGAVTAVLFGGVLDWVTWGAPFKSLRVYLRFNLIDGRASDWGRSPWWYYAATLWSSCGALCVGVLIGLLASARRDWPLFAIVGVYIGAHCVVPHKELRFIVPILPLAIALAAIGIARLLALIPVSCGPAVKEVLVPSVLAVVAVCVFGRRALHESYADMGDHAKSPRSAWKDDEGSTLLLGVAGAEDDLCGLMIDGIDRGYTGAYTYLHRNVPFFGDTDRDAQKSANYLVAPRSGSVPKGYALVTTRATYSLYRRPGPCARPPARYTSATGDDPLHR